MSSYVNLSIYTVLVISAAILVSSSSSFADDGGRNLECSYTGLKSLYKKSRKFTITRNNFVIDEGNNKLKLIVGGITDSYLFISSTGSDGSLLYSIDSINGDWYQYTISKSELIRIRNDEKAYNIKENAYAKLNWEHIGECKS